jgi:tRNA threonylcarbamoyladenosine modification (KEOPS) complex Cgi121 subunit
MRIELYEYDGKSKVIGIAEIQNSKNLTQLELVQLAESMSGNSLSVQFLNALLIADEVHLLSAAQNAINAQNGEYMLSRSLDVEIIVFASTQRQIGRALEALGVYDGIDNVAVVVVGPDSTLVKDAIGEIIKKVGTEVMPSFKATRNRLDQIKRHYQITDKEIDAIEESEATESRMNALARCVASRVALVAFDN